MDADVSEYVVSFGVIKCQQKTELTLKKENGSMKKKVAEEFEFNWKRAYSHQNVLVSNLF